MKVITAAVSGFCGDDGKFGVSGAIRLAREAALAEPDRVYIVGDLVHNQHVTDWLADSYGIHFVRQLTDIPDKMTVVIKAHGAPPAFWQGCEAKGLHIIDATCPMVRAAQTLVRQFHDQGKKIIYVASSPDHDEAISVSRQAKTGVKVVTLDELDALEIKKPAETIVLTQTTLSMLETRDQFASLQKKYPDLTIRPHLCQATTQRQQAVLDLAAKVDLLIVVGAPHSSNSRRLLEVAQSTGRPAHAVNDVSDLQTSWFGPSVYRVGVIAGASTPEWITADVIAELENFDHAE